MAFCSACGASLPDQALYCSRCSAAVAQVSLEIEDNTSVLPASAERLASRSQPPVASSGPAADAGLPIPENIAGVVAYITIIPALVFLLLEPFRRNLFVRFHAMQHLLLFGAALGCLVAASVLWMILQLIPFIRVLVFPFAGLIGLAWFFLWLLLVVKAYHHEMFKLPWIGDYAEEWSRE